ncbi:hypothetical protein F5Y16DRAFT_161567 [Xylariaceae sp. FL0255]|nr:hypothetical protein F5Y16DRAFT_161567 [Xylariaceae sp. FL0255]
MLTMTRLPPDSFLPSGAVDSINHSSPSFIRPNNQHSPSVISPLSLPRSLQQQQHSYFDHPTLNNKLQHPNYVHSPSPLGGPSSRSNQSSTLDPRQAKLSPPRYANGSGVTSPSMAPIGDSGTMSPFEHLSPQATAAAATLLQRREEHNRRALENWQAERAHLEANRARAEEMFQEERTLMDEERLLWVEQKQTLEKEVGDWKQRAETAEAEVARLNILLRNLHNSATGPGRTLDGSVDSTLSPFRSNSAGSSGAGSKFRSPSDDIPPGSLLPGRGVTMPESKPFVPLDPRMQGGSSGSGSPSQEPGQMPLINVIDVKEIIPELEGIRLKAPAIQKPTFMDGTSSSPPRSPEKGASSPSEDSAKPLEKHQATKEALRAPEHHRLTMHAGHTPNHSLSFSHLPTIDSTAAPNTAGSSGASTPKNLQEQDQASQRDVHAPDSEAHGLPDTQRYEREKEEAALEPSEEDPALKGPLMLRNRPAADEVFLRRLSDKLEEVKANDVRPSVLNDARSLSMPEAALPDSSTQAPEDSRGSDIEDVEPEIPLKLRKSTNFGQPLGQLGASSNF